MTIQASQDQVKARKEVSAARAVKVEPELPRVVPASREHGTPAKKAKIDATLNSSPHFSCFEEEDSVDRSRDASRKTQSKEPRRDAGEGSRETQFNEPRSDTAKKTQFSKSRDAGAAERKNSNTPRRDAGQRETLESIAGFLQQENIAVEPEHPLDEITRVRESCQRSLSELKHLHTTQTVNPFNWELLEVAYNAIFDEYSKVALDILTKLEDSFKQRITWQELNCHMDRHRSISRITNSEKWITAKETVLNRKKRAFKKSTSLIQSELGKMGSMDLQR